MKDVRSRMGIVGALVAAGSFGCGNDEPKCNLPLTINSIAVDLPPGTPMPTNAPVPLKEDVSDPDLKSVTPGCSLQNALLTYDWQLVGQPDGSRTTLNNAAAANPSFVPDVGGKYTVQLVVTDVAGNKSQPLAQDIMIDSCNQPLDIVISANGNSAAASNVAAGTHVALAIATLGNPNDPAANPKCTAAIAPYTYHWRLLQQPLGSQATLGAPDSATPTLTPDISGATANYQLVATVTDAAGNTGTSQILTLSAPAASACNQALAITPMWPIFDGQPTTRSSISLYDNITNTNPTGATGCYAAPNYTYSWAMLSRPAGSTATLDDPTSATPTFVPDVPGVYVIFNRVTDQLGNTGSASTSSGSISSCATSPTVVTSGTPTTPEIGQSVALSAVVTNDSNTSNCAGAPTVAPFSYAWRLAVPLNSGAVLANAGSASASFTPDVAGQYSSTVTVTDALGAQATVPGPSTTSMDCRLTGLQIIPQGQPGVVGTVQPVQATLGFSPPCTAPQAPTYAWSFTAMPAGSHAAFTNPSLQDTSFTPDVPSSTWLVQVVATDPLTGYSQTATATAFSTGTCGSFLLAGSYAPAIGVSASAPGSSQSVPAINNAAPPSLADNANSLLFAPVSVQLDTNGPQLPNADCGGTTFSYKWSMYQLPPGSSAAITPATAAQPTVTLDVPGDYGLELVTSDGLVTSAPTYFKLHASGCNPVPEANIGVKTSLPGALSILPVNHATMPNTADNAAGTLSAGYDVELDTSLVPACSGHALWTYSWSVAQQPPNSTATIVIVPDPATPSVVLDKSGDYIFQLSVNDSTANSAPTYFMLHAD